MLTPQLIKERLQQLNPAKKVLVAFSGGMDSHVLLHSLAQLNDYQVRAIHIHHGLQPEADDWVAHCQEICTQLDVPLQVEFLKLALLKGKSEEELARVGRYDAFRKHIQGDEILVTAHHQQDQAETLLLQLIRGAGVKGLSAMPAIIPFASGYLARPILDITFSDLKGYAQHHQLDYIVDPSNQDNRYDRNFLRQKVLPILRERWKRIDKTLSRVARHQAETQQLLDDIALQDLQDCSNQDEKSLSVPGVLKLKQIRQKNLIRYWISHQGFKLASEKKLQHILQNVLLAKEDAQPLLVWEGAEIRRYQDRLYIMPPMSRHDPHQCLSWDAKTPLKISSLGITLTPDILQLSDQPVTVRFRCGGEKIYIPQRGHHISLKNLLNEAGVPPWLRTRLPLIYRNNELVQVIGLE